VPLPKGVAVPLPKGVAVVPAIPDSPNKYSSKHPARTNKLSLKKLILDTETVSSRSHQWRHELEHDAESVFWLLLYWAMLVQPKLSTKGLPNEYIDSAAWAEISGDAEKRNALVSALTQGLLSHVTHSFFKPLQPLIENLAAFLVVDRHWLERSDKRNEPEYINEAFQRLILAFILENCGKEFMNHPVDSKLHVVEPVPQSERRSTTALQARNAEENKKRPSPQPSIEGGSSKRLRLDPDEEEVGRSICTFCLLTLSLCFQDSDLIIDDDEEMTEDEEDEFL
jgi:hypothetical protein